MTPFPSDHWTVVHRLLAHEVPEVADGTVELRAVARLPGLRTKLAVSSLTPGLDPVTVCVGPKARSITAVGKALGGERIDVLPWSDEPDRLVKLALAPARVRSVELDWARHRAMVFVPTEDHEMALGADRSNQILASELTGWTIEVMAMGPG
jgi:N utilization substance protein A